MDKNILNKIIEILESAKSQLEQYWSEQDIALGDVLKTEDYTRYDQILTDRARFLIQLPSSLKNLLNEMPADIRKRVEDPLNRWAERSQEALDSEDNNELLSLGILILPWGYRKDSKSYLDDLIDYLKDQ